MNLIHVARIFCSGNGFLSELVATSGELGVSKDTLVERYVGSSRSEAVVVESMRAT